jgi:hypothetical protein
MELKKENEQQVDLAKRRHAIKRLKKAAIWAAELVHFAAEVCDTRSALEAEAYACWLGGIVLLEKESDWEGALAKFGRAKWVPAGAGPRSCCTPARPGRLPQTRPRPGCWQRAAPAQLVDPPPPLRTRRLN